jgi:hypothetical protein
VRGKGGAVAGQAAVRRQDDARLPEPFLSLPWRAEQLEGFRGRDAAEALRADTVPCPKAEARPVDDREVHGDEDQGGNLQSARSRVPAASVRGLRTAPSRAHRSRRCGAPHAPRDTACIFIEENGGARLHAWSVMRVPSPSPAQTDVRIALNSLLCPVERGLADTGPGAAVLPERPVRRVGDARSGTVRSKVPPLPTMMAAALRLGAGQVIALQGKRWMAVGMGAVARHGGRQARGLAASV